MHANVEDRGIKGDITPLMAAASGGYVDIVKLLLVHGADVNAQSSTGEYGFSSPLWRSFPSSPRALRLKLAPRRLYRQHGPDVRVRWWFRRRSEGAAKRGC